MEVHLDGWVVRCTGVFVNGYVGTDKTRRVVVDLRRGGWHGLRGFDIAEMCG